MCGIALVCEARACPSRAVSVRWTERLYCAAIKTTDVAHLCNLGPSLDFLPGLSARGPDHLGSHNVVTTDGSCRLKFTASLLQLRGSQPASSPATGCADHVLCFNGEVFGGLEVQRGQNDGSCLLEALARDGRPVPETVCGLRGPWALLFWDPDRQQLWFGRDVLGRRSLLAHFPDDHDPRFLLTSVGDLSSAHTQVLPPPGPGTPPAASPDSILAAAAAAASSVAATDAGCDGGGGGGGRDGGGGDGGGSRTGGGGGGGDAIRSVTGPTACGDDNDGAEPPGTDGYWTELPPGLYSIDFSVVEVANAETGPNGGAVAGSAPVAVAAAVGPAPALGLDAVQESEAVKSGGPTAPAAPAAAAAGDGSTAAGAAGAAQQHEGGVHAQPDAVVLRRLWRAGREATLLRHSWRDPLLLELEAYRRAESLAAAPQPQRQSQPLDPRGASAGAAAEFSGSPDCGGAPRAARLGHGAAVGCLTAELAGAAAADAGAAAAVAVTVGVPRAVADQDEAARALLGVLLAAVRVRCACIETRSPHPAAVYARAAAAAARAAAATAASGDLATPGPSWRRIDPHDYSLPCNSSATVTTPATAAATAANGDPRVGDARHAACTRWEPGRGGATPEAGAPVAACGAGAAAPVMILFSGGVDSVLLAALAHRALPLEVPIDLSNVCFAEGASPDREAARAALEELAAACPGRSWRLVEVDATLEDVDRHRARLLALLRPAGTVMDLNIGAALWLAVAGQGTLRLPAATATAAAAEAATATAAAAEAAAATEAAAEAAAATEAATATAAAAEAAAATEAATEAAAAAAHPAPPTRRTQGQPPAACLASDVSRGDDGPTDCKGAFPEGGCHGEPLTTTTTAATSVETSTEGCNGAAASCSGRQGQQFQRARAAGEVETASDGGGGGGEDQPVSTEEPCRAPPPCCPPREGCVGPTAGEFYGSPARVVLLGHGADEQCGGYGRHRTRFRAGGCAGLAAELEVDVRRLWLRNLGRDDRLVSDWAREARHPFLDEDVLGFLLRLPLDCILDMRLPPGQGDKRVLRRALQLLGLPQAAARVKRAIQFGSRIGKMSNRRDFGSNRAANKKNAGGVALQDVQRAAAEAAIGAWSKPPK